MTINNGWIGKDLIGALVIHFKILTPAFAWRDREKSWKPSVRKVSDRMDNRTRDTQNKNQKCQALKIDIRSLDVEQGHCINEVALLTCHEIKISGKVIYKCTRI
jgi:hypothetical protein